MRKLKKDFTCSGIWWQPNDPDDKIHGTLYYSYQNGLKLELKDVFKSKKRNGEHIDVKTPLILGISDKGKNITLFGCGYAGGPGGFRKIDKSTVRGYQFSNYLCSAAYVPHHFLSENEIKFKKINFRLTYLDEWLKISGFKVSREGDNENQDIKINIEYSLPKPIVIKLDEDFTMSIIFYYEDPGFYPQSKCKLIQYSIVSLESNNEIKLTDFLKYITQIRYFFSLAIMKPIYPYNFSGQIISETSDVYNSHTSIFMRLDENLKVKGAVDPYSTLLEYSQIQNQFEELFQNWFKKQKLLEPVIDLYFSIFFNPEMPINNQFLGAVQAIESYHRRFKKNEVMDKTEFKKLKNNILDALLEDQKIWLKPKLDFANEPSLYYRLTDLFSEYCELGHIFGFNRDDFARKVTYTRNYLTHYSSNLEKKSYSGTDIIKATQQLKAIIQYLILIELGITRVDAQKYANNISRNQLSRRFITFTL